MRARQRKKNLKKYWDERGKGHSPWKRPSWFKHGIRKSIMMSGEIGTLQSFSIVSAKEFNDNLNSMENNRSKAIKEIQQTNYGESSTPKNEFGLTENIRFVMHNNTDGSLISVTPEEHRKLHGKA